MTEKNISAAPRPVMLCILDGWGDRQDRHNNAVALANTPNWDRLAAHCPKAQLQASETFVGLPKGQMGNSEVGHMNLGAGRVVLQDLPRIDDAFERGVVADNPNMAAFVTKLKATGGAAHLLGLLSPGGVHSHQDHMAKLANLLIEAGVPVKVHAILDGRDTAPKSAIPYLNTFMEAAPNAEIATLSGRYYAMDRDKNWDRVEGAYRAMVQAEGLAAGDPVAAVEASYADGKNDEFVLPVVLDGYDGMKAGDGVIMANFRADRAREILSALLDPAFDGFEQADIEFAATLGMVEYSSAHNAFLETLFPAEQLENTLGAVVSAKGLKQLRIAETEKYAHVTFFFNGGEEAVFDGEERILVPSPKVATYDLQPEMSAPEVTDKLVAAIESDAFALIVVNFANTDMVGHTGNLEAAIKAVEAVDGCLGRLADALEKAGGAMLVTADHGNAEQMINLETGQAHTAHTLNPVPLLLVGTGLEGMSLRSGRLADVAPTLLDLMGLEKPAEMTGESLVAQAQQSAAE
ncbi:2,3-bisphosphoglycerate-independent phosphoglycerate mutase [Aestuariispira insulae]|uniref:2,3-bisphosphoglycerate-independent phosphoglycerate mutase n=1 Tax=Aestuariispira insulae TaxID=1461337 RepID=A0A3D9HP66_9PROT|nr:2,3-bisphosphoglycerate-independent phosphoglycerate mutase [Aestuariispira insulae]RED51272.1 phosphoglycerate mutase [Aestuariispira insulae]